MVEYIPKGSMCIRCSYNERPCKHLEFCKMSQYKKFDDGTVQVICSGFSNLNTTRKGK